MMVVGRVPPGMRKRTPLNSISIASCAAAGDAAAVSPTTTGAKLSAGGAATGFAQPFIRRQRNICAGVKPCARASALTLVPGVRLSATIRDFSAALQLRRRPAPVKISTRRAGGPFVLVARVDQFEWNW